MHVPPPWLVRTIHDDDVQRLTARRPVPRGVDRDAGPVPGPFRRVADGVARRRKMRAGPPLARVPAGTTAR